MGDSKAMVEKNNHDFSHQLGVSDDYLISKFNGDFSLKRLSPQVRLKRELHLTQTDLVPTPRGQENSGRPPENGQGLDGHGGENGVDTGQGITNTDGLDLERSNLHEGTLEKTGKDSEALQPNKKSSTVVRVNCCRARTENVADREAVDIKRTRGRPRRNHKHVDDTVPESTSSSKSPVSQSTVLEPRKRGRPRKNGIPGESSSPKVSPTAVPTSLLSIATEGQRNHPCKKSKLGFGAKKDQIVRNYPLRRLFHSTSKDKLVPRRFPRYTNVLVRAAQNSSTKSQKRNSTPCIGKTSQRPVEVSLGISDTLSDVKDTTQDTKESQRDCVESCRSKLCGEPGETAISVDPKLNKLKNSDSETSVSSGKSSLVGLKEKRNAKKKSKNMSNLVRCHSVERLPLHPASVDPSAKIEKKEPFPRNSGKHVSESSHVYDFTDSADESLHELSPPVTNKPECNRGRPQRGKFGNAAVTTLARSRMVLVHRKPCSNKSEIIPSRTLESLDIVHRNKEPQKKRGRGRPRKHRTAMFPAKKNCQKKSLKTQSVQEHYKLQEEHGCVRSNVEKGAAFTELALQQETFFGDKLPEINRNNPSYVPKLVESTQEKDVSLHNTQLNPLRDGSDHKSSAMWTPCWKDKPVSEYQSGSDQVTCLTPPGSNECLSAITGDECPQTIEEPSIQKACQTPSNITTSSPSALDSDSIVTLSPSSDPGLLHFHQGEAIADNLQEMPVNLGLSPSSDPGLTYFHQGETITDSSQEMPVSIDSCSPFELHKKSSSNICSGEQISMNTTKDSQENMQENTQDFLMVDAANPVQESDGLSQIRIAKTFTLSKDQILSSCTQSEDTETHNGTNLITSQNDVPVKGVQSSSFPRRERENIFQALRGGLNSQSSNQDKDLDQPCSDSFMQQDGWQHEMMNIADPEIPRLEAYGGGGLPSHSSPHSGDSDTLPILEKETFHDTCLDDEDDDEFEFENPSDVALEFDKPSDSIVQDYSYKWPEGSGLPHSDTDIITAERVHQDLQNGANGFEEDEDEFEFETPEESDATRPYDQSPEEHPPESHIAISDSLDSKQECILDDDKHKVRSTLREKVERQTEPVHQCDEPNENQFPILGISPTLSGCSASLSGNSSPTEREEVPDFTLSQSNNMENLSITDSQENTEKMNGIHRESQEFHESQRAFHKIPSKDTQLAGIITLQNDQEKSSITPKQENISKQNNVSKVPEDRVMHEMDQEESIVLDDKVKQEIDQVESNVPDDKVMQEMDQAENSVRDDKVMREMDQAESSVPDDKAMQEKGQGESSVPDDKVMQEMDQAESSVPDGKAMQEMDQVESSVSDDKVVQEMDRAESSVPHDKVVQEMDQPESSVPHDKVMQEMDQVESSMPDDKVMQEMDQEESSVSDDKVVQEKDQVESRVPDDKVMQEMDQAESGGADDKEIQENDQAESSVPDDKAMQEKDQVESLVPDDNVIQEIDQEASSIPDDKVMYQRDEGEAHSESVFEEFSIEAEVDRDKWSNPAKSHDENSAGPVTSEEMSEEHSQSNAPIDDRKAKDETCCSTTADSSSRCQESLPVADAEELPNFAVNKCSPLAVNKDQSKNFAVCDIMQSDEGKAPTHVYGEDIVPNGQDTTEKLSRGSNDLPVDVKPSERSDFEVSTGEEKVITDVAEAPENNAEADSSIMHCEETELEKGRPGGDLHITSEHCPKTPETSVVTKKETINTSKDSELELSNGVNVLQSSDAEVQHAESPLSKAASTELQNTLESKEDTCERTSAPSRSDDCSKVVELVEQLEEPGTTLPAIPDIKESCKISTEDGPTDQIKSKKDRELQELDKVNWKSDNPISSDLKNDSDMEHSQAASLSTLQQCQMANAIQQSSPSSGFSSAEQEKQHHKKEESNNTQPCSPTQGGESADPQPSSQMEEGNQKELATEHVRQDCPAESVTTDPTVLQELVDSHTHPVDLSESSANPTNISQEKSNTDNVDSYSELPQTTEQLFNLLDAKEQSNQEKCVYLGVSTSDGTMDMLSVACEETIGGYDEDAMSTTSSCGATIAYPLSDGEDWDDQLEPNENDVSQPKSSQSSALQDSPNQITGGQHGKVVEHSSPVASCKWTVKFTKAKKRKRSRDRHHTKRKKKSHRKHKENREKSKEQDKSHHKLTFIAVGDGTFKAVDAATRLTEKQDLEQKESSQSQHQEVTVGQESIQRVDDPLVGKENIEDLEELKSPQEMQLVDNASCQLSIPKSPSCHHFCESGSAEASPHHEILISTRTDEKLESDPNSDEKPSNYVCEEKEVLNRSSEAVSVVPSSTKDQTVIVNDDPCEQLTDQESCNPPITTPLKNTVSHTQTPVPSGSLPSTHNVTSLVEMQSNVPTSGFEANAQKEVGIMLHRAQISAEKDDVGAKTVQHISHDKATFFGTPRKGKSQMRPLSIMHPALPYVRSCYITPGHQSPLFLPQHHVPMIPLRHQHLNQSGACNELKQHLLRKQKLSVPDLQKRIYHPSQGQLAALDQGYPSPQNPKSSDIVTHPSERDLALKQLVELQSQLELEKQNTNAADRRKFHMHPACDVQPPQRDLPVHISSNLSRSQSFSNISTGLGNKEGEKLLFPVSRVATAGIFSPPPADEQPRNLTKSQEQQNHEELESSRVRYTMPPTQHHVGFAADIPVFTAKGPKEQVLAVYPDGCAPILQSEISPHFNLQQNLQPAVKSFPTPKEPHPNPGKITPTAGVDQDEMLKMLRQLHGGIATTRNFGVNRGELGSQTSSVPSESPHIVKNKGLNQIPGLIHLPLPTVTPVLHQPLNEPPEVYSSNVALTEIASQRKSVVDPMHVLYHPHTVQSSQDNPLTGAAVNFPSTTSRTPTPKMHSRTPTPKSCPTYTTYASDSSTNLSLPHQPTTELERLSLSRASTPRSHGTPSSTPHLASDSTLPGQTEFQKSHISQNISAPEEDMPLDLTCKGKAKTKSEQRPIIPLDLTCKQRKCDAESQEQNAAQVPYEVFEERDIQDTLSRSRSEQLPSNTVEQYRHESHALQSLSHIQSQIAHSRNIYAPVHSVQDRSLQQHDDLSHQDLNVSGQFLNTDMLASKLRQMPEESLGAANYVLRSQQRMEETSVHEHHLTRRANVYIDRAGPPHAFSELLHIGLTSEGPGLQIAKTYNTYVNPSTTSASSIPLIDLTAIPKTSLPFRELTRSVQVPDENKEKISSTSKDHHLHVTHHLQRTRSDDTEVRYSSSNSPHTSRTSPSESDKSQLDASSIASQNILSLPIDGLAESVQVPDENKAKISSTFKDPHLHVTHHLRRTRSDDTEVRYSSSNSPQTSRTSPAESNKSQLDASSIASQSILRSVSTSNNAVASTEPNLQGAESPQNLKSKILQSHQQSASDMSHCPKKRFKRAHEATLKESLSLTPSNMPADWTGSKMTEPVPQPHPSGSRKRGRPRGSKKTFEAYKPDVCVKEPCKFCEFEATSRQQMKNHVNDVHFQKYRTKPVSEKSNITSCSETCVDKDTVKYDSLTDECHTTVTPGMELDALGSKAVTNTSKDGMPDGIGRNELSPEISEMLQTGMDYCHHCDTYFPDTTSLAAHQRSRHKSLKFDFECRLCDFSDCEPGPLVVHINKMHLKELKGGPCPFQNCSRKFLTVREIKEHLNDHWIVKKYACKICGDRYHVLSSLKAHLDRHQQNFPNMCKDYHIYVTKWNVESASYEPIRA